MIPRVLTIAGSDSGGGAGIQADLKTIALLGGYGMSAITALTVQNTTGVIAVQEVSADFVARQMEAVISDIGVDSVKTGMLGSADVIRAVSRQIRRHRISNLVVDPVLAAKRGERLLSEAGEEILKRELLPLARVFTPNLPESEVLTGQRIRSWKDVHEAAAQMHRMGAKNVLMKGGHLPGEPVDLLFDGRRFFEFQGSRVPTPHTHGTGCTLSAAIAVGLAKGNSVRHSVEKAKEFVTCAIRSSLRLGKGQGPLNPYAPFAREAERYRIIQKLKEAFRKLEDESLGDLLPEVQSNLGYALPGAGGTAEVAAFPGRFVRRGKDIFRISDPEFGASRHIASVILTAMDHDSEMRSAMNLKCTPEIVRRAKEAGLSLSHFSRQKEPSRAKCREGPSLSWGVDQVLLRSKKFPDIIFDRGDVGKEPMIRVLGHDPLEVAEKVLRILHEFRKEKPFPT